MTLEDFFTLTEMKDGLTALARVEELVSLMQKEKDSVVKNVSEAARQWSTVASTLAATENKDNLDHFIRLDGLYFLDQWLLEAQKCSNDTNDSSVEESISALLVALKKLPIDNERSVYSGIRVTVKNLFGHKSFNVQERARALFDRWNQGRDNDADRQDVLKDGGCHDDEVKPAGATVAVESGCLQHSAVDICPVEGTRGSADEDNHVVKLAGDELQNSRSSDGSQSESVKDVKIPISNNQDASHTSLSRVDEVDRFRGDAQGSSIVSTSCQESLSIIVESSIRPAERTKTVGTCSSPVPMGSKVEVRSSDASELNDFTDGARETDMIKDAQQSVMQPSVLSDADAKDGEFCLKKTSPTGLDGDTSTPVSEPKSEMVDCGVTKHLRNTVELKATDQHGGCFSNVSQDLSINVCILRKPEDLETPFSRKEDMGAVDDVKDLAGEPILNVGEDSATAGDISKPTMDTEVSDKIDRRRPDMELEYVVDDALEVARQVAKEVEREVVDYREPFCSSSDEKNSEGGVVQPSSPDSINGEQDQCVAGPLNEMPTRQNLSGEALSPRGENHLKNSKNMDKPEDCMHNPDSSQVSDAAQEPADNIEKSMCNFDLNEEVHAEEMDHPTTPISAHITVVSASRAAAPELPAAPPLHFEGELGWKGSAATSAFRPASPRRTPDGEKTHSIEGSSYGSKQRQDSLDIDLNMAGGDDDGAADQVLTKQIPVSSGLPSGESSIEVSSRRAERLKLDLNRVGDNEDAPSSDWRTEGRFLYPHRNGHRSPSPASSSSSRQPSMRNIDLNDKPSFFNDSSDQRSDLGKSSPQDMNASGAFKLDDPVISIMGTKVEVSRKECVPQTWSFLPNGQVAESPMGANLARSGRGGGVGVRPAMAYTPPPPLFGYNGLTMGPSMSLSPAMYGTASIPYMVDSRGAHVVPQIMGSSMAVPPSYTRPPFIMSMTSTLSGLNGVGPKRPTLDLNTGLTVGDAEIREPGGLRQLFIPGQGVLTDEQMRSTLQPLSSGMGFKRKEPDGGWDPYPVAYKQQSPWH